MNILSSELLYPFSAWITSNFLMLLSGCYLVNLLLVLLLLNALNYSTNILCLKGLLNPYSEASFL